MYLCGGSTGTRRAERDIALAQNRLANSPRWTPEQVLEYFRGTKIFLVGHILVRQSPTAGLGYKALAPGWCGHASSVQYCPTKQPSSTKLVDNVNDKPFAMSIADGGIRDVTLQSERLEWVDQDIKTHHEHLEKTKSLGNDGEGEGDQAPPPESPFKHMPRRKAAKVFWKVVICCVMVAWTAIMDGFLITSEWHRDERDCAACGLWLTTRAQSPDPSSPTRTLSSNSPLCAARAAVPLTRGMSEPSRACSPSARSSACW